MLRIEEIVGAMDDEFRYALDVLDDERLVALAADKAALRRLRPVGVSHAEAMAMIAAIQAKRATGTQKAAPLKPRRTRKKASPRPRTPCPTEPAVLPPPVPPLLLDMPMPRGPAIRLPPPAAPDSVIPLPPPPAEPIAEPAASSPFRSRRAAALAAGLLLMLAIILWAI
ncbi:MAG TPA: hypothetical protein VL974_08405 [Magnetospirillum sp.]|jgi:hypothetical protein|nr:hypothetical protein [Magnetospirillum sp.]